MSPVQSVLFLCYPSCGEQDTLAPWEMLRSLAWVMSRQDPSSRLEVTLGAFDDGLSVPLGAGGEDEVTMQMGGVVDLERELSPDDRADLLYVPGGIGSGEAAKDRRVLDLIRAHDAEGRWVAANGSGVAILQRAGVLRDAPVTSPATVARKLRSEGADVRVPRTMWRCVAERRLFTAAGDGAVHPSTVALIGQLFGEPLARNLALLWDTLGVHGEALFSPVGPACGADPDGEAALQDEWEDRLLPDLAPVAAGSAP